MVGPSTSDRERRVQSRRLKAGIVALVAVSGGLTATYGGAGPAVVAGAALAGGVVGAVLVLYLSRIAVSGG